MLREREREREKETVCERERERKCVLTIKNRLLKCQTALWSKV